MNPQAKELNDKIEATSPIIFEMLSQKGKEIFFPKKGILGQSADAKATKINATIGAAMEDDGSIMCLSSLSELLNIDKGVAFPYAPSFGRPDLRAKWKQMIYDKNPGLKGLEISMPVVTNALTHGLSMVAYMFADAGDQIIVSDLFWGNYNLIFNHAYETNITKYTFFDGNKMNLDSVKEKLNEGGPQKRFLLLNFPNNPSGYTPTIEETKELLSIIKDSAEKGNKIVAVCDDAYFGLVFEDGIEEQSIFTYLADLHENVLAVKIDGATKEDYVWGFRVGFISYAYKNGVAEVYDALASKTAGAVRGNISNASNLSQSLLLKSYESASYAKEKQEKYQILRNRYNQVKKVLSTGKYDSYFKSLPFNSGYFMCVELKEGLDGEKIRKILIEKYSTGLINLNNIFRLAFSSVAESQIETMFDNILAACKDSEK